MDNNNNWIDPMSQLPGDTNDCEILTSDGGRFKAAYCCACSVFYVVATGDSIPINEVHGWKSKNDINLKI